ncbi:TolC family protein [Pelobacter seleniigenes]|uniref:TolC family protein n=1 Tax=Pelobacter seleniigenes TaxID=407188 RepID=UPI0004A6D871|nr:TolC family protein [Pelobacter seleniigenes]
MKREYSRPRQSLKKWARYWRHAVVFLFLVTVSGCAAYRPMPITEEAVRARLQSPDMGQVRALAREIKHPILHPVELKADEGLSPNGAAVLAVLLNPSLRAIRDQRALSDAQILDAGLLPNPELTYSLDVPTGGDTAGRVNAFGLGLDWNVTSLITRASKVREAKARGEAVDLDIAWREWQVAQGAKAAVYQLSSLRSQIALLEQVHKQAVENLAYVRNAVSNGFMTASDLNSIRTVNSSVNERLLSLEKQADQQRLNLLRLMGLPTDSQIHLRKNLSLPSRIILPNMSLIDGLEQRRLDLLALRRGYDSQEAAVRAAVLEQFPKITIGPTFSRDTDNIRTTGFGLNIGLPIFNQGQGKIAVERATRKKLYDEYITRVFEARSDIKQVESGIRFLNEQIAAAQATEADLGKLEEDYRTALADGRADALVYYRTWTDLIDAQIKIVDLKGQLAQAVVALELATGFFEIPGPDKSSEAVSIKSSVEKEQ